jgi:hypothetical protein
MAWIQRLSVGDAVGSVLDGLGLAGGSELQSGRSDFFVDVCRKLLPDFRNRKDEECYRKRVCVRLLPSSAIS